MKRAILCRPGEAVPPPEPAIRVRDTTGGRRVGAYLPLDLYVAFKAHVAATGRSGERAIVEAIESMLGRGKPGPSGRATRPCKSPHSLVGAQTDTPKHPHAG